MIRSLFHLLGIHSYTEWRTFQPKRYIDADGREKTMPGVTYRHCKICGKSEVLNRIVPMGKNKNVVLSR